MSPTISTVVATRNRPELLTRALDAIAGQDYDGIIETLVVFDQSEPDMSLVSTDAMRPVTVLTNNRTPGLAGARNTGSLAATGEWLAFCDDDDEWLPSKVQHQIKRLTASAGSKMATTGIAIVYGEEQHERIPRERELTFEGFISDRMTEVHPSSFLLHKDWFVDDVGLVDEELPGSYAEDYDVLLRAARLTTIVSVPEPLVRIYWHEATYFRDRWTMIDAALEHLLAKFPEFGDDPRGCARILGQRSFAQAAAGNRRDALRTIWRTARRNPLEPRSVLALAVTIGLPPSTVMNTLHRFGRGL